jgi:prepilin-type N-terminal cleavage/methylation domain-containing protein
MKDSPRHRGFTLVEMAVVLVIIGLILTVVLPLLTERIGSEKLLKGRKTASSLKQEIIGFALANDYLPTLIQTQSMGNARDAWDNLIAYWADPSLTGTSKSICAYKSKSAPNNLNLRVYKQGGTTQTYENVAFVIASRGANQNLQEGYTSAGITTISSYYSGYDQTAGGAQPDIDHEVNDAALNDGSATTIYDITPARNEAVDDIVEYVTFDYLLSKLDCGSSQQPKNADVSFADNMGDFQQAKVAGTSPGGTPTITVGDGKISMQTQAGSGTNDEGCLWYTGNATAGTCSDAGLGGDGGVCDFNYGLRVYFTFQTERGSDGGWTFTVLGVSDTDDVANNEINDRSDLTTLCGGYCGSNGYASTDGATGAVGLYPPKIGLEFDYYGSVGGTYDDDQLSTGLTSPATTNDYNALAWIFWRNEASLTDDVQHSAGSTGNYLGNPPGNPAGTSQNSFRNSDGKFVNGTFCNTGQTLWMEDGNSHALRIDYIRNATANWVNATVYYNCTTAVCRDLSYDFNGTQGVDFTFSSSFNATAFPLNSSFNNIRFGWTFGDCGGTYGHKTTIGEFGVTFR